VDVAVWATAHLAVNSHRARLGGALDEGARGPFLLLGTTAPTDRRGIIASGIEIQAGVVSTEGKHEDDNQQGEHEGAGAEIGWSTTENEEERRTAGEVVKTALREQWQHRSAARHNHREQEK
jgi:hypothetical protein